ncbi:MAG: SRPBCC family protein [Acidimicrobiales bacterium]
MDTITDPTAISSVVVDAPAARLWAIVADVTRIPEWSPVCHRVEWLDGSHEAVVGARFRGHNKLNGARWARDCVVTEAEPGKVLGFSTLFKGQESTRWRYQLEPAGGSTTVREAYQVVLIPPWLRLLRHLPGVVAKSERDTAWNVSTSLERLKAIAEST